MVNIYPAYRTFINELERHANPDIKQRTRHD